MKRYILTKDSRFGMEIFDTLGYDKGSNIFTSVYGIYPEKIATMTYIRACKFAESDNLEELIGILCMDLL